MDFSGICSEREPTRERHIIISELEQLVSPVFHPRIWELIAELENAAWEAGADEGYDYGRS